MQHLLESKQLKLDNLIILLIINKVSSSQLQYDTFINYINNKKFFFN